MIVQHTYTIPQFLLPYIIDGDISGYEDYEIDQWVSFEGREVSGWREHFATLFDRKLTHWHWDEGESQGFCHTHALSPEIGACACVDLTLVLFIKD